ncbi:MAG: hypothetical protein GXO86_14350 [Chlorobi bacterium]|nr:hypothetical protein [Chlorobiota bacterium]
MKQLFLLILLLPLFVLAQVSDDFEDGDFTKNPVWTGAQAKFKINDKFQLQLKDTAAGTAYLSTANSLIINTEWQFWVKLSFSPSANNNARFYLVSDNEEITGLVDGYFIQLGEAGSNDAIELFRQQGENLTSVCRGQEGFISSSFAIRIKVTRDDSGTWKIFADPSGGENFQFQCQGNDNTFTETAYIGIYCKYTKSNSTKMYFDDVYAGPQIVDTIPPELISVSAGTDTTVQLYFSEGLDNESSENVNNYEVSGNIGTPVSAALDEVNSTILNLIFEKRFEPGEEYTISVSGVKDLSGNTIIPVQRNFSYYLPQPFDVVINEIMADPSPPVGLPNYEYLELLNRTNSTVNLDGWTLVVGTSEKYFGPYVLEAGGYLILAKIDAENEFLPYGNFYGFSSFSLTNSGQILTLVDKTGTVISQVAYTDKWYKDPDKEDGGWSLEQINPANVCSESENWKASIDTKGGTPGAENSIYSDLTLLPGVNRLEVVATDIIRVYFNQMMDANSISEEASFEVDNGMNNPAAIYVFDDEPSLAELYFDQSFQKGTVYHLTVKQGVANCMGLHPAADTTLSFGLAEKPEQNDVVINEILFNPWTGGTDFVEIYNRSEKVIDLNLMQLGTVKISPPNPPDTLFYNISNRQKLFVPGEYLVMTSSPEKVKKQYYTENPDGFLRIDPFPAYNNDEGICILSSMSGDFIDVFNYSEDLHYPLLQYVDGVSLERTNFDSPTQDPANWHSAAESAGFATPAYKNSQFVATGETTDEITIDPEIFSPDNDGYQDILSIKYRFDQAGYMMSVIIFNQAGQKIRQLVNNEYLGTEGVVNWDGIDDQNRKAPVGIYVFYIRVFDTQGNVKEYKKTGVLATKLR